MKAGDEQRYLNNPEGVSQHPLTEGTYEYGRAFEEFVIAEALRLNSYGRKNFKFSYIRTEGGVDRVTIYPWHEGLIELGL